MGSVRVPAAYCGCYGIKPTYGLVSTRGVAPLAWTLDHVGPLAKTPADLAILLEVLVGYDAASPDAERIALDRTPFDPVQFDCRPCPPDQSGGHARRCAGCL